MTAAAKGLRQAALRPAMWRRGTRIALAGINPTGSPMSRILITGSPDGLGLMAAQLLVSQGHEVVLHARNQARVADARAAALGAAGVLAGDLSSIDHTRSVA